MDGDSIGKLLVFLVFIGYYLFSQAKKAMRGKEKPSSSNNLVEQANQLEQQAMLKQAKLLEKEKRLEQASIPREKKLNEKIKLLEERLGLEHETITGQMRLLDQSNLPKQHIKSQKEKLRLEAKRVEEEILTKKENFLEELEKLEQERKKREQEKIQNPYERQKPSPPVDQQIQPKFETRLASKSDEKEPARRPTKVPVLSSEKPIRKATIENLFRNKKDLSRAILMKEILGPPPSLK